MGLRNFFLKDIVSQCEKYEFISINELQKITVLVFYTKNHFIIY